MFLLRLPDRIRLPDSKHKMTELVCDFEVPQTFKTVCVKCHSCRPLSSLLDKMCCK